MRIHSITALLTLLLLGQSTAAAQRPPSRPRSLGGAIQRVVGGAAERVGDRLAGGLIDVPESAISRRRHADGPGRNLWLNWGRAAAHRYAAARFRRAATSEHDPELLERARANLVNTGEALMSAHDYRPAADVFRDLAIEYEQESGSNPNAAETARRYRVREAEALRAFVRRHRESRPGVGALSVANTAAIHLRAARALESSLSLAPSAPERTDVVGQYHSAAWGYGLSGDFANAAESVRAALPNIEAPEFRSTVADSAQLATAFRTAAPAFASLHTAEMEVQDLLRTPTPLQQEALIRLARLTETIVRNSDRIDPRYLSLPAQHASAALMRLGSAQAAAGRFSEASRTYEIARVRFAAGDHSEWADEAEKLRNEAASRE